MSTAAARALKERQKNRSLPTIEVPQVKEDELARTLYGIQEHLRMYEGDSGAPKERFITMAELENAGLIKADVKGRFAYISQVLEKDVAQKAGSTANPTQTEPVKKDTSRTSRVPSGGSGAATGSTASAAKLNDAQDVNLANPANNEFLYYDGNKFTNFPLFKRDNVWFGLQKFEKPVTMREQANGPAALEGLGYVWIKDGTPNTLWFTDDAGTEAQLGLSGVGTFLPLAGGTMTGQLIIDKTTNILLDADATTGRASIFVKDIGGAEQKVLIRGSSLDKLNFGNAAFDLNIQYNSLLLNGSGVTPANWDTAYGWGDHSALYAPLDTDFRRYTQTVNTPAGGALTEIKEYDGTSFAASDQHELLVRAYVVGTGTNTGIIGRFYSDSGAWTAETFYASGTSSNHPRLGLTAGGLPAIGHYHPSAYGVVVEAIQTSNRSTFGDYMATEVHTEVGGELKLDGVLHIGGDTIGRLESVSGGFGSVQVSGVEAGATWEGYNIAGRGAFMWNSSTERGGIYDDVNNRWVIQWNPTGAGSNEELNLYAGTAAMMKTQFNSTSGNTSGGAVLDHGATMRDIGFNILPTFNFNASDTLEAQHCGHSTGKTNTTSYTLTGPASSNVDFPVGGVCTIMNLGASVAYSIADTATCTMYVVDGSSVTDIAGTASLAAGGICTLYRYSTTAIYLFGSGLTA